MVVVKPWLDDYKKVPVRGRPGGSFNNSTPWKLCLHTVEGSIESALGAYNNGVGPPHATVDLDDGVFWQHIPLDRHAYALRNLRGGTETNKDNVIQVELGGFAADTANKDLRWYSRLAYYVVGPILDAVPGIAVQVPSQGFTGVDGYGKNGRVRMSAAEWDGFSGILGHSHVPENTHWDPGALNGDLLVALLTRQAGGEGDMYFEKYADPEAGKEYIVSQKRDGKIVYREFSVPRGDGQSMAGLSIVLNEWNRKGIVQKVVA